MVRESSIVLFTVNVTGAGYYLLCSNRWLTFKVLTAALTVIVHFSSYDKRPKKFRARLAKTVTYPF